MIARTAPRAAGDPGRLLVVDAAHSRIEHHTLSQLPALLEPRDLLVVNDAATLPASIQVVGRALELRLAAWGEAPGEFQAVVFGGGDYRIPTEQRAPPEPLHVGDVLHFADDLQARITDVDPEQPRLVRMAFGVTGAALLQALYRVGRPIQYAYVPQPLALWDVQNRFATRAWAFELPSAGQALNGEQLTRLRERGVGVATVTHAAGISSTGDVSLDRRLPLAERFCVPAATARAVFRTRERGGRIVALGTTVARALESSFVGRSEASVLPEGGVHVTHLRLNRDHQLRTVDAILSGMHEPGSSHFELLEAFAPAELLARALEEAEARGYHQHEFGDSCLVWA